MSTPSSHVLAPAFFHSLFSDVHCHVTSPHCVLPESKPFDLTYSLWHAQFLEAAWYLVDSHYLFIYWMSEWINDQQFVSKFKDSSHYLNIIQSSLIHKILAKCFLLLAHLNSEVRSICIQFRGINYKMNEEACEDFLWLSGWIAFAYY